MNKPSIAFLEQQIARAISKSLTAKIPNLLELLGRELTSKEKELLIKSAVAHSNADCLIAALTITGFGTESLTDAMIIQYNKKSFALSRILNWKLDAGKIEKLIRSSLLSGEISYASEYTASIGRKLTLDELVLCTKALAGKKFPHVDYIPEILKLWGKQQLPTKYRKIIIGKYKKAYHYEGFKTAGGTRRDVDMSWFTELINKLCKDKRYNIALKIICDEKLFKLPNILKLFKYIGKETAYYSDEFKEFLKQAPATVTSKCFAAMIPYSQALPGFFLEKYGFQLNDTTFTAFIKRLKSNTSSDRVEVHIEQLKLFRHPTASEGRIILNYIARSGNYELFLKTADKYSFKVTPSMIRILEKNAE